MSRLVDRDDRRAMRLAIEVDKVVLSFPFLGTTACFFTHEALTTDGAPAFTSRRL